MTSQMSSSDIEKIVRVARTLMDAMGQTIEEALNNPAIPESYREIVRQVLERERVMKVHDPHMVEDPDRVHHVWLPEVDRAEWYYWPRLRSYLIDQKGWPEPTVRSIDNATDKILGALENPRPDRDFDTRGLVVGYVQSGKTANYSSLIAKAADTGYRLIIVLSGMHNSLRLQTQKRLDAEIVGVSNRMAVGVGWPQADREWHAFTKADLTQGDFNPGNVNATALSGANPVLVVAKKHGSILRKLNEWLDTTQDSVKRNLPCLVIDDEADQASINTGGNRAPEDADPEDVVDEEESPSRINERIRTLLTKFHKVAYVAYTATPFANVLIEHTAEDRSAGPDLYPRSFILSLPRPEGYVGAEEIFGTIDDEGDGLNVIRLVPDEDVGLLVPSRASEAADFQPVVPESLRFAILDFVLAGAARIHRGYGEEPSTMLVHTSYRTVVQQRLKELIEFEVGKLRDEWRYLRLEGLQGLMRDRWESEFQPVTRAGFVDLDVEFDVIAPFVSIFLEQLQVRQLHSQSEDELDYDLEKDLKVIVVGGNRLSRGLTLEGLLISYFLRPSITYDTLMQMGRWFGFRNGYVDLTRIYTTMTLARWFRDLATVEEELHREIARYEREKLTPLQVGVRIRNHPSMLVTSPLKMGRAQRLSISFENQLVQTVTFGFEDSDWLHRNIEATRGFISALGEPYEGEGTSQPVWTSVNSDLVVDYLQAYATDPEALKVQAGLLRDYILRQNEQGELTNWLVSIRGLDVENTNLGSIDLGMVDGTAINLIERTRLRDSNSLKTITSPSDQFIGLSAEQVDEAETMTTLKRPVALRHVRDAKQGVLLIYPISRYSGYKLSPSNVHRIPIHSEAERGEHVIGIALIFPHSLSGATVEYTIGTVGVRTQ